MSRLEKLARLSHLPIILAPFVLMAPVYLLGKALFWGTPLLQFVPWWSWAWATVLEGHLPLWNPMLGMGAPLLANYQSALFYPPHWIYSVFFLIGSTPALAWAQAVLVAVHLAWAGLGMAMLVRRLGLGQLSQVVGGLAFGLCGYLVSRAGFLSINATVSWLPWILLCLTPKPLQGGMRFKRFFWLVICLSMQFLAGHAQISWYTLILSGLWVGFWGWATRYKNIGSSIQTVQIEEQESPTFSVRYKRIFSSWGWLALAVILAICLAAVQLFPTAEYLSQSQRAEAVDFEFAMNYSFWPWRLLTLVAPDMFGNPVWGDYWGYGNYWEDAIYVGLLPFFLSIAALLGNFRRRNKLVWFLLGILSVALLLGLGKNTPVFPWLYQNIPTFDMFQAPTRLMIWVEVALALLAAMGTENWHRPEGRSLYWTRLGTAGAFAVSLGSGLAWYTMGEISPTFIRATALMGIWGVGIGMLSLTAPLHQLTMKDEEPPAYPKTHKPMGLWGWSVAVFVTLDLLIAGWGLNPGADLEIFEESPLADEVRTIVDGRRMYVPEIHEQWIKYQRFLRFDAFDPGEDWLNLRAVMLPNENILDNLPSVNNFDPLLPGRYATWMGHLRQAAPSNWSALLKVMDVGAIEIADKSQPYGVRFIPAESYGRAWWVPCARAVQNEEEAWGLVVSGKVDFRNVVILEGSEASKNAACHEGEEVAIQPHVFVMQYGRVGEQGVSSQRNPNRLIVRVRSTSPGWTVVSEVWYPGWLAFVDGDRTSVLRANYLFRAVYVPAGEHEVLFVYQPVSFWAGLIVSLLAWLAVIIFWFRTPNAKSGSTNHSRSKDVETG